MLQHSDILTSIKARWDRDGTLRQLIPGELHYRENTGTAEPWATFWLDEEEIEFNSGNVYIQDYTLTLGVFNTRGPVEAGKIGAAIDRFFNRDRPQDFLLPGPNARFLDLAPDPSALELDEDSREARSVLLLSRRYALKVQAER